MNALTNHENTALSTKPAGQFDLTPQSFEQALTLADYLSKSDMVPKQFQGKPGNCLIAMQWGFEVGLKPLQALQGIAVINGKPNLYGDAGKALLLANGCLIDEDDTEIVKAKGRGRCKITRPGRQPVERTFSMDDARTAQLLSKDGPWKQYPHRQLAWRAFWFAARDAASDILRGMGGAEEAIDSPRDMGPAEVVSDWPADLLAEAEAAASKGATAYMAFWKTLSAELQPKLAKSPEHVRFKEQAQAADRARTVDAAAPPPPAQAPAAAPAPAASTGEITTTFAEVEAKLRAARTVDALAVALDWSNALAPDEQHRAGELLDLHDELKAAMQRGGAK